MTKFNAGSPVNGLPVRGDLALVRPVASERAMYLGGQRFLVLPIRKSSLLFPCLSAKAAETGSPETSAATKSGTSVSSVYWPSRLIVYP